MKTAARYHIGQFSQLTHLPPATLRYYEQEGLLAPERDASGQRFYTDADRSWLEFILHLKGTGMTITELKEYVALRAQGDGTIPSRLALLKEVQKNAMRQLEELTDNIKLLNQKIDWYEEKQNRTISDDETFAAYLKRIKEKNQNE
ncbi:MerR family transcriptional regulator [Lactobacillus sp. ESL0228]|uniref:MerR family transcriptional regulator n=1 Tax=Lactobacillus sp. ESL0228 TaxID=2069352 RepID=UPI000EFA7AF3|nr:MerR family transcriptional regulator [Lactobacillus sp. ESL0228]RMC47269.1 MerR family transcriptional regulator [Lactobacillus sp. ESL0228]